MPNRPSTSETGEGGTVGPSSYSRILSKHTTRISATALTLAIAICFPLPSATANAADSISIGQRYEDGLDSRHSATRLRQATDSLGYSATGYTEGRNSTDAFHDGIRSAVLGLFGHANAGVFEVLGGPPGEYLGAGTTTDVVSLYSNFRWWSEYIPYLEVDDMRLAIFAGCYTSNSDPAFGSWPEIANQKGVDATVTFPGLVYFPANCASCNYSGNYFWDRFSAYVESGNALETALNKARSDLVAKEGSAAGWDEYFITGTVESPERITLASAPEGEPFTSDPAGAGSVLAKPPPPPSTERIGGRELAVHTTEDGAILRTDLATGEFVDYTAGAASNGGEHIDEEEAIARAEAFLGERVPDFEHFSMTDESRAEHGPGDARTAFTWRTMIQDAYGPSRIDVEIDRRTGSIVYASVARTTAPAGSPPIDEGEALELAHTLADGEVATAHAELDAWDGSWRWTVTLRHSSSDRHPDVRRFIIDATSGELLVEART